MLSPAFIDLSATAKVLFVVCKMQINGVKKNNHPNGDQLSFTMNKSKWCDKYHLYKENNEKGFQRDIESLIEHGFISCEYCGALERKSSIYRFSSKWKIWGTEAFRIEPKEMTYAMQKKLNKKNVPYGNIL